MLAALKKHKLLRDKRLGIDASMLEANASLRSLENRPTCDAYGEYVKKLAEAAGVDPTDSAAVRRFDRKREGRTTSNKEWKNSHDPDAMIGKTKRGSTRMIYKPEHIVDLDTGAVEDVDIRPGNEGDTQELAEHVLDAEKRMNVALGNDEDTATMTILVADKGYYQVDQLAALQQLGIKTVISDPIENRRLDKLKPAQFQAKRSATSNYGKRLLKRRGMRVERSFDYIMDCGGA